MPLLPLAEEGNFIHVYDFKVKSGKGDEFISSSTSSITPTTT
jgi:hypothetical protein